MKQSFSDARPNLQYETINNRNINILFLVSQKNGNHRRMENWLERHSSIHLIDLHIILRFLLFITTFAEFHNREF